MTAAGGRAADTSIRTEVDSDAGPVIVIVATIAGAAWTAAWSVQRFIAAEISASEARLAAQIAETRDQIAELRQYIVDHLAAHAESD